MLPAGPVETMTAAAVGSVAGATAELFIKQNGTPTRKGRIMVAGGAGGLAGGISINAYRYSSIAGANGAKIGMALGLLLGMGVGWKMEQLITGSAIGLSAGGAIGALYDYKKQY